MSHQPVAIIQNGYAIFGVGDTLEEAVADAREWVDSDTVLDDLPSHSSTDGEFYWAYATPALAALVRKVGGDIARDELEDGTICLPWEA